MKEFKKKPRTPAELVKATRQLLTSIDFSKPPGRDRNSKERLAELTRNFGEMKLILYGSSEAEPVRLICVRLAHEIFKDNTFRLMIESIPNLELEARKDTTQILANLQMQSVCSRHIAGDYLEKNKDLLDLLIFGYENPETALHYGTMLRVSIRHPTVAQYLLESRSWKRLLTFISHPNFLVASDALATFEQLMTRHKPIVAEYLADSYDLFFDDYNKLLESPNYFTRGQGANLLGNILLDRSNTSSMMKYISSQQNLVRVTSLVKDSSKRIQMEAFHVFKLFVSNPNKPQDIVSILVANRETLLRFLGDLSIGDEQFQKEKVRIMTEIKGLP